MSKKTDSGFTLAELLIALAILGVIATFTIPKVLNSYTDGRNKAICKETAAMISAAYDAYRLSQSPTANTGADDLTPYMNFVAVDTSSPMDCPPNTWCNWNCGVPPFKCLKLHSGAMLSWYSGFETFGGTSTTNAIQFWVDPDGKITGQPGDAGSQLGLVLYYNGFITSIGYAKDGTSSLAPITPIPLWEPSWFSWD